MATFLTIVSENGWWSAVLEEKRPGEVWVTLRQKMPTDGERSMHKHLGRYSLPLPFHLACDEVHEIIYHCGEFPPVYHQQVR
jgi:hypothetical protein